MAVTLAEQRRLKDENALLKRSVDDAHARLEELQSALVDAPRATPERGPVDAELLYTVRQLSKFDAGQFEAVNR